MTLARINGLERILTESKQCVFVNEELSALHAVLFAQRICLTGSIGFYAQLSEILQTSSTVFVKVCCNTHHRGFVMLNFYAIEQRLKLGGIPG